LQRAFVIIDEGGTGQRQQWQILSTLLRRAIRRYATQVLFRVRESHLDRCVQAVDVFTNFASQEVRLRGSINHLYALLNARPAEAGRYEKRIRATARHLKGWHFSSKLLGHRARVWRIPPDTLYNARLRRFVQTRVALARSEKRNRANR